MTEHYEIETDSRELDRGFRRARARLAAFAMHQKHPDLAREAGRRGGESTSTSHPAGKSGWGVAMALRRWQKPDHVRSRAPSAGPGDEGEGTPEPGPAPARTNAKKQTTKLKAAASPVQPRLL